MLDTPQILTFADLDACDIHDFNPRKDSDDAVDEIDALARSIAEVGLEYPLAALITDDRFGIVDGGRRLRALRLLRDQPALDPEGIAQQAVPLLTTPDPEQARTWAMVPFTTTKPLHPADEIRAFAEKFDAGHSPDEIARAYGVTNARVQQRLRLASLPDAALDALKADRISLDTAKALTLARDEIRQTNALDAVLNQQMHDPAGWVRRDLATGAVLAIDRRARFVGVALYRAEGGELTDDLFGDATVLHDEKLLDRLFARELDHKAELTRAEEGWQWVRTTSEHHLPWSECKQLEGLHCIPGELPAADLDAIDRLRELSNGGGLSVEDQATLEALEIRLDGEFTDEDRARGGIYCYVDHAGDFQTSRAYAERNSDTTTSETDGPAPKPETAKPAITATAVEDLHRVRLLAQQTALLSKPELLLDLLAFSFEANASSGARPFALTFDAPKILPEKQSGLLADARLTEVPVVADWQADVSTEALIRFRDKGRKHRNTVLATALARHIQPSKMWQTIWALTSPDVRALWTPDAANLFSAMRADALDALWSELTGLDEDTPEIAEFRKMKKGDKAKRLEALFSDASVREALGLSRDQNKRIDTWLPELMGVPEGDA